MEFCISRRPHNKPAKKNRSGSGDCFAIIVQAAQWKMPPFAVPRKTHVVNGALGYEAQLINAVVASINVISDRFRYDCCGNWDGKILSFYTNLFISLEKVSDKATSLSKNFLLTLMIELTANKLFSRLPILKSKPFKCSINK